MPAPRPDIRYVFLSDLHLGEENSLLTNLEPDRFAIDAFRPSPVLEQLVACLRQLLADNAAPPVLVLNGDVLDLAFGTISQALMSFERLIELLVVDGRSLVSRIFYLPGNHDHHVWEIARETQYVRTILGTHRPDGLPEPKHATPLDGDHSVPSYLLNQIVGHVVDRHGHEGGDSHGHSHGGPAVKVEVVYPNLGLRAEQGERYLVVHHGHYVESLYHFISDLRRWVFPDRDKPQTVQRLEAENFAWIDFVWSLLGRSGAAGTDVEAFFKMLHYPHRVDRMASALAERLARARNIPGVPGDWLETRVLEKTFRWLGRKVSGQRREQGHDVARTIDKGLRWYLFGPTFGQIVDELGGIPEDLAFVFGHTHKPFEKDIVPEAADGRESGPVSVVNTGGWTVDAADPQPANGASILVADEKLEMVTIRVYQEPAVGESVGPAQAVAVGADRPGAAAFHAEVSRRMRGPTGTVDPAWTALARRIDQAILERRQWIVRTFHD